MKLASLGVLSCACGGVPEDQRALGAALSFSDAGAALPGSNDPGSIPTDEASLRQWLADENYAGWHAWSEVGPTLGAGGARVYLNDVLRTSLRSEANVHPTGAVAVRELYEEDFRTLKGYSVLIKVDATDGFDAWHCFEVLDLDPDRTPAVAERGALGCEGCHAEGRDFIRSSLPLP